MEGIIVQSNLGGRDIQRLESMAAFKHGLHVRYVPHIKGRDIQRLHDVGSGVTAAEHICHVRYIAGIPGIVFFTTGQGDMLGAQVQRLHVIDAQEHAVGRGYLLCVPVANTRKICQGVAVCENSGHKFDLTGIPVRDIYLRKLITEIEHVGDVCYIAQIKVANLQIG